MMKIYTSSVANFFHENIAFLGATRLPKRKISHAENTQRAHNSLDRSTPAKKADEVTVNVSSIYNYRWKSLARGLFQLPIAA